MGDYDFEYRPEDLPVDDLLEKIRVVVDQCVETIVEGDDLEVDPEDVDWRELRVTDRDLQEVREKVMTVLKREVVRLVDSKVRRAMSLDVKEK